MVFADRFAVPACAGGVDVLEMFLVGFAGPFEGGGQFVLVDFVVMVDEDGSEVDRMGVVGLWGQLMRVPCEVNL